MSATTATSNPISNDVESSIPGTSVSSSPLITSSLTENKKSTNSTNTSVMDKNMSRKDLISDCALVEIIHLHDCLRGALSALEKDLTDLSVMVLSPKNSSTDNSNAKGNAITTSLDESQFLQLQQQYQSISELESKATARFQVIWSVFRAHSAAEDEFIWPTLRSKTQGAISGSPCGSPCYNPMDHHHQHDHDNLTHHSDDEVVEQEEYEEDHADEERMFTMMDHLLTRLHKGLVQLHKRNSNQHQHHSNRSPSSYNNGMKKNFESITNTTKEVVSLVRTLNQHLMVHLEKEEKQCLPLVVKHLSKSEIHDLVGKIMGKRSSDMIVDILTMAVQNLKEADQEEMVKHMKQAMIGTFFDKWLSMTGWNGGNGSGDAVQTPGVRKRSASIAELSVASGSSPIGSDSENHSKRPALAASISRDNNSGAAPVVTSASTDIAAHISQSINNSQKGEITSQANLEKLIRAVVTNPSLTPMEKNTTIQGLRASVWKRNQEIMGKTAGTGSSSSSNGSSSNINRIRQSLIYPSAYYQRDNTGNIVPLWKASNTDESKNPISCKVVPKFTATELAPTYHDGTNSGNVLGCHHYARACKLRHPVSGKLYTCRLCSEQEREASVAPTTSEKENAPLDRYAVTEISCMKCKTLQPSAKNCINSECELHKKGFAKYFCDICNLFDDRDRPIFHCPYCNTCRMGKGLGIDFRHCMRCNACVSLADKDHRCIPQKLQGSCPICHDTLFNSTEPLKGLRCGHVMHLSCFTEYCRGQNYTCPLCMRCMEDMSDYFALLDQAVRMQPMPAAFQNTIVNIIVKTARKLGNAVIILSAKNALIAVPTILVKWDDTSSRLW
eukprot:CAMPEP_0197189842 /NCGR_PEP_ID=MMETSP1423-20130617/20482_1 /TAXON_ID=476441 /ORGANISM="Pseudo-nitzschia heimii, Strain UNC1101" /LENGTH=839 /DNA_ID=CAMNT_0042642065 /DNA_START=165 /DNA_END=2682 /DNA_ORIENTATION=+